MAEKKNGGVTFSARLLSLLSLQIAGTARENLKIEQWFGNSFFKLLKNDGNFNLTIKNNGNVDLPVVGQLILKDRQGNILKSQTINLGNALIPGTRRFLETKLSLKPLLIPGFYQAEIVINYGQLNQTVFASTSFCYLPFWLVLIILLLLLFLFILFKKRQKNQHYESGI